jgi:hypothetical protein
MKRIAVAAIVIVLLLGAGTYLYLYWYLHRPQFQVNVPEYQAPPEQLVQAERRTRMDRGSTATLPSHFAGNSARSL